jgi:hypothetical protein
MHIELLYCERMNLGLFLSEQIISNLFFSLRLCVSAFIFSRIPKIIDVQHSFEI